MNSLRKKIFAVAGYNTTFFGPGRKEFNPSEPMPPFEDYLKEVANGSLEKIDPSAIDEGIIGSFMSARFLKQANLPGFLPFMIPELQGKPCTAVEGACGTGGRAIAMGIRSILSDLSDTVFVAGFEMQNGMKSVYGADILAGAAYYKEHRKSGHSYFFPGVFAERAGAYFEKYGHEKTRKAMAKWYENAIINARKNPKAQEFHNKIEDLFSLGMTTPNPEKFLPHINLFDCSKISDGASAIILTSEEGLKKLGVSKDKAIEIVSLGEAEGDITKNPEDMTFLTQTQKATQKALKNANISAKDLGLIELHDCFTITGLLMLEAIGVQPQGQAADWVLEGNTSLTGSLPVNASGGLIGFGHPTGASGVRMLVDLQQQFSKLAPNPVAIKKPYGLLVSMGGNDKTVTSITIKNAS